MNAGLQACHDEDWDEADRFVATHRASLDEADDDRWTMAHHAVWHGRKDLLESLLAAGADPARQDAEGLTPGTLACAQEKWDLAGLVASNGKGLGVPDQDGWTMLHYAAASNQERLTSLLLANGADPTIADRERLTPALAACAKAQWGTALILANTGKALGAQDEDGWSIAHYATDNAQPALLESLVRGGAPLDLKNAEGRTPADIALNTPGDKTCLWAAPILIKGGATLSSVDLMANGLASDGTPAARHAMRR